MCRADDGPGHHACLNGDVASSKADEKKTASSSYRKRVNLRHATRALSPRGSAFITESTSGRLHDTAVVSLSIENRFEVGDALFSKPGAFGERTAVIRSTFDGFAP
jgi:hypothetical protein